MTRAYSYLRCSTPEQLRGDSFRRQAEGSARYAAENGLILDDTLDLNDRGISAFKGANRDASLGRFLAAVEEGRVAKGSYLLVESLDRLSRQTARKALRTLEEIVEAGITVVTLSDRAVYTVEAIDNDPLALMRALLVMMRAHEESSLKSTRVAGAWARKRDRARQSGEAMTRRCPGWLEIKDGRYVQIENRAVIVRWLFEQAISGRGKRTLAAELNRRSEPVWGRGKRWHDSYVQKILASVAVFGRHAPLAGREAPIDNYFPAVVDEDTYWRAQAALGTRRTSGATAEIGRSGNVFHGIGVCQTCGGAMHFVDKGARSHGPVLVCGESRVGQCENTDRWLPDSTRLICIAALDIEGSGYSTSQETARAAHDAVVTAKTRVEAFERRAASLMEAIAAGAGASLAAAHAAAEMDLATARRSLADAEAGLRAVTPSGDDTEWILELLRGQVEDPKTWNKNMAAALTRTVKKIEFGREGSVRIERRNGTTASAEFPHGFWRRRGEILVEHNAGWWTSERGPDGRQRKRGKK
jgi:DNA invertase Pin-like site-specific DNA recombinase